MSESPEVSPKAVSDALRNGAVLIDVRQQSEYNEVHIPGAALIPLPAVKKIGIESRAADGHAGGADKMVALRLQDGEVIRGYVNGSLQHHQYGLTLTLYSRDKKRMDTLAIPYTSLKALFYVKTWDSRPPGFQLPTTTDPPLTQLLGDIREVTRLYKSGRVTREEFLAQRKALLDRF